MSPNTREKAKDKFPPSRQVQTRFHYSGPHFPREGEGGKKDRIIHHKIIQEKDWILTLERESTFPTVGERGKLAALWSAICYSYEERTAIPLYCCSILKWSSWKVLHSSRLQPSLASIRLGWKGVPGTNTLAYHIEIGLERAPFVVFVYFFLIWTCKKPADYGPQQH